MASISNIFIDQGATFTTTVTVSDANGDAVSLTGYSVAAQIRKTFLWEAFKEPYWCAIIAFALNTGAYTSEILRSAFETIKIGYIEAGKSLGISKKLIFYKN